MLQVMELGQYSCSMIICWPFSVKLCLQLLELNQCMNGSSWLWFGHSKWRHYLLGLKFTVRTVWNSLCALISAALNFFSSNKWLVLIIRIGCTSCWDMILTLNINLDSITRSLMRYLASQPNPLCSLSVPHPLHFTALDQELANDPSPSQLREPFKFRFEPETVLANQPHVASNAASPDVLIKWKGLQEHEASWEPFAVMQDQFPAFHLADMVSSHPGSTDKPPIQFTYSRCRNVKAQKADVAST